MGNLKNLLLKLRQIGVKRKLHTLAHGADILAQIEINCLRESGIKGIILDLDNTIISEDDQYLSPGGMEISCSTFKLYVKKKSKYCGVGVPPALNIQFKCATA